MARGFRRTTPSVASPSTPPTSCTPLAEAVEAVQHEVAKMSLLPLPPLLSPTRTHPALSPLLSPFVAEEEEAVVPLLPSRTPEERVLKRMTPASTTRLTLPRHTSLPMTRKRVHSSTAAIDLSSIRDVEAAEVSEVSETEEESVSSSMESLTLLSDDDIEAPVLTRAEKKEAARDEAEKLLKKHRRRIHKLVSCCIVPLGALTLLRRVMEGLIG